MLTHFKSADTLLTQMTKKRSSFQNTLNAKTPV
jgi:hypothetical protein